MTLVRPATNDEDEVVELGDADVVENVEPTADDAIEARAALHALSSATASVAAPPPPPPRQPLPPPPPPPPPAYVARDYSSTTAPSASSSNASRPRTLAEVREQTQQGGNIAATTTAAAAVPASLKGKKLARRSGALPPLLSGGAAAATAATASSATSATSSSYSASGGGWSDPVACPEVGPGWVRISRRRSHSASLMHVYVSPSGVKCMSLVQAKEEAARDPPNDVWVECARCAKWRRLPLGTPAPADDDDADWFCEMVPGLTCDHAEEASKGAWREEPHVVAAAARRAREEAEADGLTLERRAPTASQPDPAKAPYLHVREVESKIGRPYQARVSLGGGLHQDLGSYIAAEEAALIAQRFVRCVAPSEEDGLLGRRLEIYWPLDAAWYECEVSADYVHHYVQDGGGAGGGGGARCRVTYLADGWEEELELGREAWRTPRRHFRRDDDGAPSASELPAWTAAAAALSTAPSMRPLDVAKLPTAEAVHAQARAEGLGTLLALRGKASTTGFAGVIDCHRGQGVPASHKAYAAVVSTGPLSSAEKRVAGKSQLTAGLKLRLPEQAALIFARFQKARRLMAEAAADEAMKPLEQLRREAKAEAEVEAELQAKALAAKKAKEAKEAAKRAREAKALLEAGGGQAPPLKRPREDDGGGSSSSSSSSTERLAPLPLALVPGGSDASKIVSLAAYLSGLGGSVDLVDGWTTTTHMRGVNGGTKTGKDSYSVFHAPDGTKFRSTKEVARHFGLLNDGGPGKDGIRAKEPRPKKQKRLNAPVVDDGNDSECTECGLGGDLLCCDSCPRAFHFACLRLREEDLPDGDWYCAHCLNAPAAAAAAAAGPIPSSSTDDVEDEPVAPPPPPLAAVSTPRPSVAAPPASAIPASAIPVTAALNNSAMELDGMDAVRQMLTKFRLEQYVEAFDDQGYDDLPFLMAMDPAQLNEVGEATGMKPGHVAKLQAMLRY